MKRKLHAYCVGTVRSGTSSMAGVFSSCYRSEHEPHPKELLTIIQSMQKGRVSPQDFRKYVLYLDHKSQLDFNSSFLNLWQLKVLVSEYPKAKFIFTIRDCYSWLNSWINCLLEERSRMPQEYKRFLDMIFGKGKYRFTKEERILQENGLYALDGFLSCWAHTNNEILTILPSSRMMVVKTHEIGGSMTKIADFLGILPGTLDISKSHINTSVRDHRLLSKIDKEYLSSKMDLHCKTLMERYFPGFIYDRF